jgi:hypothetical protein
MAFDTNTWSRQSVALNTGIVGTVGGPAIFSYRSTADAQASIAGANYFADEVLNLSVGDLIFAIDNVNVYKSYRVSALDRDAGTISTTVIAW